MAATPAENTDKWVWRPRWPARPAPGVHDGQPALTGRHRRRRVTATGSSAPPWFAVAVALVLLVIKDARALGFFELQILEIENYRGQLATGECCGGSPPAAPVPPSRANCIGAAQCNTLFRVCLREYQSRQPAGPQPSAAQPAAATAPAGPAQLHCSFGNTSSPVLGGNSFTLTDSDSSDSRGHLSLPFSFSWTRSFTFILHAMDYNNYTGSLSVIEEATYSGILLPGNEWKALSHLGHTARMAYRVRVQCDRFYYGQTCTKLCKPRDDRFGHYTCGDTDGRKECIPGWQGENCDKAVCKTGCHPVHGKCDYPGGCECRKGWQGELCDQCMTYPGCKHGYCNGTSWQCICDINWGGILCDQDLNYCGTHEPCLNGGTCKSTAPDRYTCSCPEGFSGSNCDVVLNPCATEPCLNGGKCTTTTAPATINPSALGGSSLQPLPKQFHCECQPGWTGSTCNTEIDECALIKPRCLNGGTCVDKLNDWTCLCPDRWRGLQCEIDVDECESQQRASNNQATCGPNAIQCRADNNGTQCVCRKGWATNSLNNNGNVAGPLGCPVNIDDCAAAAGGGAAALCMNGGTCVDLVASYVCTCPVGYTGQRCQTQIDPCDSLASANPCKNGGECVRSPGSSRPYSCICPLGYSGDECEINRDHCTPNPCRNGGQCFNTPDDYYCHCTVAADGSSWHGKNCTASRKRTASPATSTTSSSTTVRLPAVVVQQDTFRDIEDYYYNNSPQTCADSRVCLNGGTCVLAVAAGIPGGLGAGVGVGGRRNKPHGSYRCKCPEGYRGHHCEFRQEDLDFPNQHGGGKRPKVEYEEVVDDVGDHDTADSDKNDYQYYYWTGVACGSLTIIAVCLLLRFGYQQWKKRNGGDCAASTSAGKSNAISNQTSNSNNNLMLLVQRQNEENLRRYSAVAANSNKLNGGGGGGGGLNSVAGALSTSSLNCSRISIVHPLCQQPDTMVSQQQQQQHQLMEIYGNKTGGVAGGGLEKSSSADDKTGGGVDNNPAAAAVAVKPAATIMVTAVAGSPQHHQLHTAIPLCKKQQNVEQQQHHHQHHVLVHPQQAAVVQHNNNVAGIRPMAIGHGLKDDQTLTALI